MKVKDIMTKDPEYARADDPLDLIARKMRDLNVGAMPVKDNGKALGILTDRDIAVRAVAGGSDPRSTKVRDVMSRTLVTCEESADIKEAARLMEEHRLRRLLVVSAYGQPVGILSMADLARHAGKGLAGEVIRAISAADGPR